MNRKFKRGLAGLMAVAMVFSTIMAAPVSAKAAKKTVTVKTQKQLERALKQSALRTIVIKTDKKVKLTVKSGSYKKVKLTIDAPKATIVNKGKFSAIKILDAGKVTEQTKANSYQISGKKTTLVVGKNASVGDVKLTAKNGAVQLKVNGRLSSVSVNDKTKVTISGKTTSRIKLKVYAKGASVKIAEKQMNVIVENHTGKAITVEDADKNNHQVQNGASYENGKVQKPDESKSDDKKDENQSENQKPEQEKPADQKPENGNTSSGGSTSGGSASGNENTSSGNLSYDGYQEVWKDDFDGTQLNRNDWNVETHEPGWVNSEWQEYVDSTDNIQVKDGTLVIQPIRTQNADGTYSYTSGRVNTQNKHDFKYGLFEAKVKVPTGKGYLPAFWMMPTDENLYGQWPRCGEIDIMEVMGQDTKKAMGTIHYGNPHAQKQGDYTLNSGDFASQWHTFSVEWEPGKIVWYVDGVKYHEANDWYSTTEGQGTVAYPAPFDQKFYMILNLAVGGSWVGYPDDTTTYEDQSFAVDYVKVYQKEENYYKKLEEMVQPPKKPEVTEPADGVYVKNGNFETADDLSGKNGSVWQFMTQQGGEAEAEIISDTAFGEGAKAVKISTTKAGTENYAVQFVQAAIPVKQGGAYRVTFDAYAAANRKMIVDVSAPDYNYARYLNDTELALTTSRQTYSYDFTVTDHDDANARLEFNLGKTEQISDVYISNIKIEKTGTTAIDTSKKVLTDGNYVSNGKFQEGTEQGKKGLLYWAVEGADCSVTDIEDGRRAKLTPKSADAKVLLTQKELPLVEGSYEVSFDVQAQEDQKEANVTIAGKKYPFTVSATNSHVTLKLTATDQDLAENKDILFDFTGCGIVYLDNVRLVEDTLIKNGSFNAGMAGFELYAYTTSDVSYVIDSQTEDNAFDITIKNTNDEDWKIQLKQSDVVLEESQCYKLSFDIKSSIDRSITYAIQRNGAVHKNADNGEDWTPYVQETKALTAYGTDGAYTHIENCFKMKYQTDEGAIFNIAMGGGNITTQHRICIDNIVLEKIDESEMPEEPEISSTPYDTNLLKNVLFANDHENWMNNSGDRAEAAFANGSVTYQIADVGTNEWDVELVQYGITVEKGENYEISFDVASSIARKIKVKLQQNGGNYEVYVGKDVDIATDKTKVTVSGNSTGTDGNALFAIDMGKLGDIGPHNVTISNLCVKKVKVPQSAEAQAKELVESIKSDWSTWSAYAIEESASADITIEDNKASLDITNVGTNDYDVALEYKNKITLEQGKTYRISAKVNSSVERAIKASLMNTTYEWYGGNDITLTSGENTIDFTFTVDKQTADDITFKFSMGKMEKGQTPAGKLVFTDIHLVEVL